MFFSSFHPSLLIVGRKDSLKYFPCRIYFNKKPLTKQNPSSISRNVPSFLAAGEVLFQPSIRWIYINDPCAQSWGAGLYLPGSKGVKSTLGSACSLHSVSTAGIKWDPIDTDFSFPPQWERLWFLILTSSFFLTLVWFYFWWEVHNDYNEINWWVELPLGNLVVITHLLDAALDSCGSFGWSCNDAKGKTRWEVGLRESCFCLVHV